MVLVEPGPDHTGCLKMTHLLELLSAEASEKQIDCLAIPLELGNNSIVSPSLRNNLSRILGDSPYVTALTQEKRLHASLPVVIAKGFE